MNSNFFKAHFDFWGSKKHQIHSICTTLDYRISTNVFFFFSLSVEKLTLNLKEGNNKVSVNETLNLRRLQCCYKMTSTDTYYIHTDKEIRVIDITFSPQLAIEKLPSRVFFYFTSEKNIYGIESGAFFDGHPYKVKLETAFQTEKRITQHVNVKPTMIQYLRSKSECKDESFWETFEPVFVEDMKAGCANPCSPLGLPEGTLDFCLTEEDWNCSNSQFDTTLRREINVDVLPCEKVEYQGERITDSDVEKAINAVNYTGNPQAKLLYEFRSPETMTVSEEYYIMSMVSMVGSIGGTLGLFIGLSFTRTLRSLFRHIREYLEEKEEEERNRVIRVREANK